jgi:hypothetical protein
MKLEVYTVEKNTQIFHSHDHYIIAITNIDVYKLAFETLEFHLNLLYRKSARHSFIAIKINSTLLSYNEKNARQRLQNEKQTKSKFKTQTHKNIIRALLSFTFVRCF